MTTPDSGAPALTLHEAYALVKEGVVHVHDNLSARKGEMEHAGLRARAAAARSAKWREKAATAPPARQMCLVEASDLAAEAAGCYLAAEAELKEAILREGAALAAAEELREAWNVIARTPRTVYSRYGNHYDNPAWLAAVQQYTIPHGRVTSAQADAIRARRAAELREAEGSDLNYRAACAFAASQGRGGQVID